MERAVFTERAKSRGQARGNVQSRWLALTRRAWIIARVIQRPVIRAGSRFSFLVGTVAPIRSRSPSFGLCRNNVFLLSESVGSVTRDKGRVHAIGPMRRLTPRQCRAVSRGALRKRYVSTLVVATHGNPCIRFHGKTARPGCEK